MPIKPITTQSWSDSVRTETAALWDSMDLTETDGRFEWDVAKCLSGKSRYREISRKVNPAMPWWFVAVIHGMECSYSFSKHLHNGDPLAARTKLIPSGRPKSNPPFTFEDSAFDALTMSGKAYHLETDWSLERCLWRLEGYNGYGYRLYRGIFSPYIWAGTNHYTRGKYVRDGVWSSTAISTQAGCAGVLKLLGVTK